MNKNSISVALRSGVVTPRPCAKNSVNLEPVDYNRGDKALQFGLGDEAWILYRMSLDRNRTSIINNDGIVDPPEATFSDDKQGLISYQTTKASEIGRNHYTIRNCDGSNYLNEINFFVHVSSTAAYVFERPLQTIFRAKLSEVTDYMFPSVILTKNQEKPLILVEPFEGYEDFFPASFLITFDTMDRI